jgi:hypothetical protein
MARTKAQLKKLHRELWQWLADNPTKGKQQWPPFQKRKQPFAGCFACECAGIKNGVALCHKCPCDWGGENVLCAIDDKSPFMKWRDSKGKKTRTKYALQVRDAWK